MNTETKPQKKVFGRKFARGMGKERIALLENLLPEYEIVIGDAPINPYSLSPTPHNHVTLEIGFGDGDHMYQQALRASDTLFLGCEPFMNGVSSLLKQIKGAPQGNIRIFPDDAMVLVNKLMDKSVDSIYILNPDPWPKSRHRKRRIVQPETLDEFARILKPGGSLIMATDVNELAEWMATHASIHPAFSWTATRRNDWTNMPEGWIQTKYELKGANHSDKKQSYLIFSRV